MAFFGHWHSEYSKKESDIYIETFKDDVFSVSSSENLTVIETVCLAYRLGGEFTFVQGIEVSLEGAFVSTLLQLTLLHEEEDMC